MEKSEILEYLWQTGERIPESSDGLEAMQACAQVRATAVMEKWLILGRIFHGYGDVLASRWGKKTNGKKRMIIGQSFRKMNQSHVSIFDAILKWSNQGRANDIDMTSILFPYLNLEDLCLKDLLIIYIYSRAKHAPHMFSFGDMFEGRIGFLKSVNKAHLNGYTMCLSGVTTDKYGKIKKSTPNTKWIHPFLTAEHDFHASAGFSVLCIQELILEGLIGCCKAILHDSVERFNFFGDITNRHELDQAYSDMGWRSVVWDETSTGAERRQWDFKFPSMNKSMMDAASHSWSELSLIRRYQHPTKMDFDAMQRLIYAKLSSSGDVIQQLREDPGYFLDRLVCYKQASLEGFLDIDGKPHPNYEKVEFWVKCIKLMIQESYSKHAMWKESYETTVKIASLAEKYKTEIRVGKELPQEYLLQILILMRWIGVLGLEFGEAFRSKVWSCPSFQYNWVRHDLNEIITRRNGKDMDKLESLVCNFIDEKMVRGLKMIKLHAPRFDFLMHYLANEPKESARLSPFFQDQLSDIGMVIYIQEGLRQHLPWSINFEEQALAQAEKIGKGMRLRQLYGTWDGPKGLYEGLDSVSISKYCENPLNRFHYPFARKRTKQSVEIMRESERNLELFWEGLDTEYSRVTSGMALDDIFAHDRTLVRTPEWVEPSTEDKPEDVDETLTTMERSLHTSDESTEPPLIKPKEKVKKRGLAAEMSPNVEIAQPIGAENVEISKKQVDARCLRVVESLFFKPNSTDAAKELSWQDFVYTMAFIGFKVQQLQGSSWYFEPGTDMNEDSSIEIHQPHPKGKHSFRVARRIGRRLSRRYGWTYDTFVPKIKGTNNVVEGKES